MTRLLGFAALEKETLGWGCRSIVRSPVVSTICTVGPDVAGAVPVEWGQFVSRRQAADTNESWKSLATLR
ncbi:MAG: hypothetical protein WAN60_20430 [Candidatus Sulfotelmatobacter sp.]